MSTELEKIINDDKGEVTPPASSGKPEIDPETGQQRAVAPAKTPEEIAKEEHLSNLNTAISTAEEKLSDIRKETKQAKAGSLPDDEDELPDLNQAIAQDPTAKAWDKRMDRKVSPVTAELEKEKAEVRSFALREFLDANPALARDQEKVKQLMAYYERIRTASERTREGVLLDLRRAAAVVFHDDILNAAQSRRAGEARADAAFSMPAIDSGATGYRDQSTTKSKKVLSAEERQMLARWNMTEEQWRADAEQFGDEGGNRVVKPE